MGGLADTFLVLHCGGNFSRQAIVCLNALEIPVVNMPAALEPRTLFQTTGWLHSLVRDSPPTFDLLCPACARLVYPADFISRATAALRATAGSA